VNSQYIDISTSNATIADVWSDTVSPSEPIQLDLACGTFLLKNITYSISTVDNTLSVPFNATLRHSSHKSCLADIIWMNNTRMEINNANEVTFENIRFGVENKRAENYLHIEVGSSSTVIFQNCSFYGEWMIKYNMCHLICFIKEHITMNATTTQRLGNIIFRNCSFGKETTYYSRKFSHPG
jgi:hypothetical protein